MTGPSQFLPHLAATLKEERDRAGLTLREMEAYGRERSSFYRLERYGEARASSAEKYWPNLDEYVSAYANALGCEPVELWAKAITRYADALVGRGALTARPSEGPKDAGRRIARQAGEQARARKQSHPQARPKSREG